jgi:transposase
MSQQRIERVDSIPVIVHWLKKMWVQEIVDTVWRPHGNWQGLSYGQLAVLFLTYVLYMRTHRLSEMEKWVTDHRAVLEKATGWEIRREDAIDDHVGILLDALGAEEKQRVHFQREIGKHMIQAYALPTEIARYDTTTFNVYHDPVTNGRQMLRFGKSKDRRPDLLQFKQGLGTLDPAGVPLLTATLPGNAADDPLYVPSWREMVQIIGHSEFLYIADSKAAAVETRGTIDCEGGYYLFPLPMTGDIPDQLYQLISEPPVDPMPLYLENRKGKQQKVGCGFVVEREIRTELESGTTHQWRERWLVTQSTAHAKRQRKALQNRLHKAERDLQRLRPKREETAAGFHARAERVIQQHDVVGLVSLTVEEAVIQEKRYLRPGRPRPDSPYEIVEQRQLQLHIQRNESSIERQLQTAGWRVYVTNTPAAQMSLNQAIVYYRGEWLVERGFHRFKKGSLPALPLYVRIPERIRGLLLLLTVALQALTLLEFVAHRELETRQETIAGLVPGNPKIKTNRPSAERLLAQFTGLHLLIEETETQVTGHLVETLTPLQRRILDLLSTPATLYDLSCRHAALTPKFQSSA